MYKVVASNRFKKDVKQMRSDSLIWMNFMLS